MSVVLVNNNGGAEGFVARLFASLEKAMQAAAKAEEAELVQALSVPVSRNFAGEVVQRSVAPEDPRMDTRQLVGNVESRVEKTGDGTIVLAIGVSRPDTPEVPAELEYGWGKMKGERPFMRRSMARAGMKVGDAANAAATKQT